MNLCITSIAVPGSDSPQMQKPSDLPASCTGDFPRYKSLQDFWAGKAQTLLHKCTHTKYFKDGSDKTLDYISGVQNWLNLAAGSHKPKRRPNSKTPCADENGESTVCDPILVPDNANTLSVMAGGKCHLPSTTVKDDVIDDSDDDDYASLTSTSQSEPTVTPLPASTATALCHNSAASSPAVHASDAISGAA